MARMMIVDDSSFLKGVLKFILERGGHKVVGLAESYHEALEMYRTLKPDVVFCDILLGDREGLQLVKAVREIDPRARIISVSIDGQEDRAEEARSLGACAHVEKPYGVVKVADAIDLAFRKR